MVATTRLDYLTKWVKSVLMFRPVGTDSPLVDNQVRMVSFDAGTQRNLNYEIYNLEFDSTANITSGNGSVITTTALNTGVSASLTQEGRIDWDVQNDLLDIMLKVPSDAIDSGVAGDWQIGFDCIGTGAAITLQAAVSDDITNAMIALEDFVCASAVRDIVWMTSDFGDHANLTNITHLVVQIKATADPSANSGDIYKIYLKYPRGVENQA